MGKYLHIICLYLFVAFFFLGFSTEINAQVLYQLNLSDPTGYTKTCGTVVPAHWTVNNALCSLTTSNITVPGNPATHPPQVVPVSVRYEGSSMGPNDSAIVFYSVNGVWTQQSISYGQPGVNTHIRNFSLTVPAGSVLAIRIVFANNHNTERWRLFNGDITVGSGTLPVELVSFIAQKEATKIKLTWVTATELNNHYFTIERSLDGIDFCAIGKVDGNGTMLVSSQYEFFDLKPSEGINYYRLKQTDINGKVNLPGTLIAVRFSGPEKKTFDIYPNPSDGNQLYVRLSECDDEEVLIVVSDNLGKALFSKIIPVVSDGNVVEAIDPYNRLLPGVYIITATSRNQYYMKKLIIR